MHAAGSRRSSAISISESKMSRFTPSPSNSARNPAMTFSASNSLCLTGGFGPCLAVGLWGRSFRKWNHPPEGQGFALSTLMQWHTTPSSETPHQSPCRHIGHGLLLVTLFHPFILPWPFSPC